MAHMYTRTYIGLGKIFELVREDGDVRDYERWIR